MISIGGTVVLIGPSEQSPANKSRLTWLAEMEKYLGMKGKVMRSAYNGSVFIVRELGGLWYCKEWLKPVSVEEDIEVGNIGNLFG